MNKTFTFLCGAFGLLALSACDNTYTPSLHHQAEASTGSHLAGTDTGADAGSGAGSPTISNNAGGPGANGGGR